MFGRLSRLAIVATTSLLISTVVVKAEEPDHVRHAKARAVAAIYYQQLKRAAEESTSSVTPEHVQLASVELLKADLAVARTSDERLAAARAFLRRECETEAESD